MLLIHAYLFYFNLKMQGAVKKLHPERSILTAYTNLLYLIHKTTRCVYEMPMPPQRPFFQKLTLTDDLGITKKGLATRYTQVKYEGPNSCQSKDMAHVKVLADKQTDEQAKNYMPQIYRCGGIKIKQL